jgi:predicted DCC family thiol-disulfide oxidoreductase YuxK
LPASLADLPQPLYLFDGYCVLCSGFVNFCLDHDGDGRLKFASTQSAIGARVLSALALPPETLDQTVMMIEDGDCSLRSTAALRAMKHLRGWPRCLGLLLLVPRFVRDPIYDLVARNRYKWFGQRQSCHAPTDAMRGRFIDL